MADITKQRSYADPRLVTFEYGSVHGFDTVAWDHDVVHGCVCDSSWSVGFGPEQQQLAEYFGADCSLRELYIVLWSCRVMMMVMGVVAWKRW